MAVYTPPKDDALGTKWLIDIGPFFDRFEAAKIGVLSNSNSNVRACIADVQSRKWIDLKRADVAQAIDLIIAAGVSGVDAALKERILNAPVTPNEQLVLIKLYFS